MLWCTGRWLLCEQYLHACHLNKCWLREAKYEWGPKYKHHAPKHTLEHLQAPRKWRRFCGLDGAKPFDGWIVAVIVKNTVQKTVYERYVLSEVWALITMFLFYKNIIALYRHNVDSSELIVYIYWYQACIILRKRHHVADWLSPTVLYK